MGRKDRYESHVKPRLEEIRAWYQLCTEAQIAKKLGISMTTFGRYKREHPELREVLKEGRETLVEDLKVTLKKKAQGYYYEETKTVIRQEGEKEVRVIEKYKRYYHPDTGAIHLLLKNLDDDWRNDDRPTMEMKRQHLQLAKQKAEEW